MGGGAAMRAASKVTGGFSGAAVFRGAAASAAPQAAEQAVRKSSIPVSAVLSSSSRGGADVAPAIQRSPEWEIEGWEFAGVVDDGLVMASGEPMPRVVFSGVPSFDEAKEATLELKEALNRVYLSPAESFESRDLVATDKLSDSSLISKSDAENELGLVVDNNGPLNVPSHAIRAFKLLSTSSQAQDVVASIASDKNVWTAVMSNPVLQEFIESNKNKVEFQEENIPEKTEDSSANPEAKGSGSWFKGVIDKIKHSTVNFVTLLSGKLKDIFGPSDVDGDAKSGDKDEAFVFGTPILGLVTMVVMVVLFKRIHI